MLPLYLRLNLPMPESNFKPAISYEMIFVLHGGVPHAGTFFYCRYQRFLQPGWQSAPAEEKLTLIGYFHINSLLSVRKGDRLEYVFCLRPVVSYGW